jgi:hypothetical protein
VGLKVLNLQITEVIVSNHGVEVHGHVHILEVSLPRRVPELAMVPVHHGHPVRLTLREVVGKIVPNPLSPRKKTDLPVTFIKNQQELDGPAVSALRRAIAEFKQRWSVIGWVTKNVLSPAPPCFGTHDKPLVPAAFSVVSTHQTALGPRELWPVLLKCMFASRGH